MRIAEAQAILKALGLPVAQQNEFSALTLLSLANLGPQDAWRNSVAVPTRPHNILLFINERYGRAYAENTRETVRRQVLHQLEQAAVVVRNADDPKRPTNSPNTNYRLTPEAHEVLQRFGAGNWEQSASKFRACAGSLAELYQKPRELAQIEVVTANGQKFVLSPGAHNQLQAAVVQDFAPRFTPGARILYFGDTAEKALFIDAPQLLDFGVQLAEHGKLADVVLFWEQRQLLVLVEVVTSHGPVSPKRWNELEEILSGCEVQRIYVSAFPSFTELKKHVNDIAWETEVWVAEVPDHMIHYDGEKFFSVGGPPENEWTTTLDENEPPLQ